MADGNGKNGARRTTSRARRRSSAGAAKWVGVALAASVSACFLRSAIPGLDSGLGVSGQGSSADAATARSVFPLGAVEQAAHDFEATLGAGGDLEGALARL